MSHQAQAALGGRPAVALEGRFGWVDLLTDDLPAAQRFYGDLFGWAFEDPARRSRAAYSLARTPHGVAAGLFEVPGAAAPPPAWTPYVVVSNVVAVASLAGQLGGRVLVQPRDVAGAGYATVIADAAGCTVAAWQPGTHWGADVLDENGALAWNELITDRIETAQPFHAALFAWDVMDSPIEAGWDEDPVGEESATFALDGVPCAGIARPRPGWPRAARDRWLPWFAVADMDAALEAARMGGGTVLEEPRAGQVRRSAVLRDPRGAVFGLLAMAAGRG